MGVDNFSKSRVKLLTVWGLFEKSGCVDFLVLSTPNIYVWDKSSYWFKLLFSKYLFTGCLP